MSISEILSHRISPEYFQMFYVYLFSGSLLYLTFVYMDLLIVKQELQFSTQTRFNLSSPVLSQNDLDNMLHEYPEPRIASSLLSFIFIEYSITGQNHAFQIGENQGTGNQRSTVSEGTRRILSSERKLFSVFPRNWIDNNVPGKRSQCASFYLRIGTVCQYLSAFSSKEYHFLLLQCLESAA